MNRVALSVLLFLLLINSQPIKSQNESATNDNLPSVTIPFTQSIMLPSVTNGKDYQISIGLPASYESSHESYPVLYIFDPDITFGTVTEFARFLSPGELPEIITVGVGYGTDDNAEIDSLRHQDFESNPDGLLNFMREELMPLIESTYRTKPSDRALVGFSSGGSFVLFVFTNEPELFKRYIAISPSTIPGSILLGKVDVLREKLVGLNMKLFLSMGARESAQSMTRFASVLEEAGFEELTVTTFIVENGSHISGLHPALLKGIQSVYCGSNDPSICGFRVRQGD